MGTLKQDISPVTLANIDKLWYLVHNVCTTAPRWFWVRSSVRLSFGLFCWASPPRYWLIWRINFLLHKDVGGNYPTLHSILQHEHYELLQVKLSPRLWDIDIFWCNYYGVSGLFLPMAIQLINVCFLSPILYKMLQERQTPSLCNMRNFLRHSQANFTTANKPIPMPPILPDEV